MPTTPEPKPSLPELLLPVVVRLVFLAFLVWVAWSIWRPSLDAPVWAQTLMAMLGGGLVGGAYCAWGLSRQIDKQTEELRDFRKQIFERLHTIESRIVRK